MPTRARSDLLVTRPFEGYVYGEYTQNDIGTAIGIGANETTRWMGLIVGGLASLVGSVAADPTAPPPVSGPVGIATQLGDIFWNSGPIMTLYVAGILSANLAVVNILPFPPLDGGRMLMIMLKRIVGARMSLRAEQLTYVVGFGFLFAFIIWITCFDIDAASAEASRAVSSPEARRPRHATVTVDVGGVLVGSAHPVVVQSMTNTDTADADGTAIQVAQLAHAGSQIVRVTVNYEAAAAVPEMVRKVRGLGVDVPIVGDFHYNGHQLLTSTPTRRACSTSTGSTRATSVRSGATSTSRRSSGSRSSTTTRSASASTGARWTSSS